MSVKSFSRLNYAARNFNVVAATMVPVYSVSASSSSINEGTTVTYTITTQYVLNGTVLYWTTSGTTVAADFSDGVTSGSVTMTDGTATIVRTLTSDITTEGAETIVFELRTVSTSGTIVASTPSGTVNDTSVLTITPSTSSVNEGSSVTWTISAVGFGTGTLYYTNSGTTSAADFSDGLNSGSIAITADSGTLTKTLLNDLSTEGSETIIIQIRTGSTSGTVVGTSNTVTVADTSYSSQGYSVSLPSGANYINIASNSNFVFTGDFTIEAWVNMPTTATGGPYTIFGNTSYPGGVFDFRYYNNAFQISLNGTSSTTISGTSGSLTPNLWYHVAAVRSGSTVTVYVNGKALGTTTNSSTLGYNSTTYGVGSSDSGGSNRFIGKISNIRVVNGTAVYTANFNPPTDNLASIANTKLLINGATIADASGNNTLTTTGTPVVRMENPFGDSSILLDGSSQYLTIPSNAIFALPGNFTVEGWYYFNTTPGTGDSGFAAFDNSGTGGFGFAFFTTYVALFASNVADQATFNYTWQTGVWYHVAFARVSTTVNCYINGVPLTPVTGVSYSWAQAGSIVIGKNSGISTQFFNGYISNFRIVKGTAVYTTNFIPSTSALTAITNTTLLTFQYSELFDASTNKLAITNVGSAPASNQNPFGNYYASFNGTSQYLSTPYNSAWSIPAGGAFCMEAWVYITPPSTSQWGEIMAFNHDSGGIPGSWAFFLENSNSPQLAIPSGTSQGGTYYYFNRTFYSTVPNRTWTHVAITRDSSGAGRAFINGVLNSYYYDSPTTGSGRALTGASGSLFIGSASNQAAGSFFPGYMTNVRFVNGSVPSAYATSATTLGTQAFTAPTTPLTAVTDTKILTCQYADIVDSSINVFPITNTGTVKTYLTDTFSGIVASVNYAQKNYSLSLNGSSQYITVPTNASWTFTGTFTIEGWFQWTSTPVAGAFFGYQAAGGLCLYINATSLTLSPNVFGTGNVFTTSFVPSINTWYHIALTRNSSNVMTLYANGVSVGTATTSAAYTQGALTIGNATTFAGYMSNIRLTNTNVYTGAFTPSTTPLKAITGTSLLTAQYNTLFDASTNKLAITKTGSPDMVNMYPFPT